MAETVAIVLWEIGGAIATEAAIFAVSNAVYINAALAVAASSAYGAQQKRQAASRARAAYTASLKDRELMIRSAVSPRRVIYGRDKVSGPIVYAQSTGSKGEYLHLVIVLAAHECDAIETIYFNDIALPEPDGNGDINTGEFAAAITHSAVASGVGASITLPHTPSRIVYTSRREQAEGSYTIDQPVTPTSVVGNVVNFAGADHYDVNYEWQTLESRVRISKHLGAPGQTADSDLIDASAGNWTEDHRGAGICYLYVRLQYDTEVFGQIGLPNISAVVRGKKVRDPRTGLTTWSENTALQVADWLLDTDLGLGAAAAEVPDSEVIAEANICDESVATSTTTTQARYTFNGSFTTEQSPRDTLADLLSGMAGSAVWTQGRWLVRAGASRTPTVTIAEDSLAGGGITIVPKATRSDLFNAVRVTYRDPDQGWAQVQAPLVTNATYEAADGGVRIVRAMQLPGAMDSLRAQRLAKIELERERQALTVQLVGNLSTYDLAPTDACYVNLARYGFANKLMEVRQRTWAPDGTLPYLLRETAAGVWAWNYGEATTVDLAPDTTLPNPYQAPAALTGLSAASGTAHLLRLGDGTVISRALVQWAGSTNAFVTGGGQIEVGWKRPSDETWQTGAPLPGDSVSTYLQAVPDGVNILIRVRPVNSAGRSGAWTTISHLAVGKSAPPSDPVGLAASVSKGRIVWTWTPCPDADYFATELRLGGTDWASAAVPAAFIGAANTYPQVVASAGTYVARIKHIDGSANPSTNDASASQVVAAGDLVQDGEPGDPGTDGVDGTSAYVHIRYSNDGGATFTASSGTVPGAYIGTYTDSNPSASGSVGAYTWALIKGADGTNGTPGATGADGQTSYLHIKWSNDGGSTFTASAGETPGAYIGTYTDFTAADSGSVGAYTWALVKGADGTNGTPGAPGTDGQTSYLHIKWSNDGGSTFTASSGETPGAYIGTYTDFMVTDSSSPGDYTWALVKGADGTNGVAGTPGADGLTSYLHIKWSNDGGSSFTGSGGEVPGAYIGTYTDFTAADSASPGAYTWALVKGADGTNGTPGAPGADGQTSYLHIKWSNDGGATFTASSGETPGTYIGTYTDFTLADSTSPGAYTWALVKGADGTSAAPSVTSSLSQPAIVLQADAGGAVASFALAVTTMKVYVDLVDDTANWAFTRGDGSGVTTGIAGNTVSVTAMSVDASYFEVTATRATYPTQTIRCGVTKVRSQVAAGMNPGFTAESMDLRIGASGSATARLSFENDGRIYSNPTYDTPSDAGDWYLPHTTSIGSSYSVRVSQINGSTMSGAALNTWHAISGEPSFELGNGVTDTVKTAYCQAQIALTSDTSIVLATGYINLEAEKSSV